MFVFQGFKKNSLHIQAENLGYIQKDQSKSFLLSNTSH